MPVPRKRKYSADRKTLFSESALDLAAALAKIKPTRRVSNGLPGRLPPVVIISNEKTSRAASRSYRPYPGRGHSVIVFPVSR